MAKETMVVYRDDLSGEQLKEDEVVTIRFGYRGTLYRLEVSEANAKKIDVDMQKYIDAAAREGSSQNRFGSGAPHRGRPATAASSDKAARKEELNRIRMWWRNQGHDIGERGRIPQNIIDAYEAAHA